MGQILFAPAGAGVTSDDVTATKAQVLSGYTALTSDSDDEAASGSMTNNGAWTSSSSGSGKITIPAGYHNGSGYVDCSGAYNKGVTDADARANSSSTNYKSGYNSGYSAGRSQGQADVKANPGSYGLESGGSYQNGYNTGKQAILGGCQIARISMGEYGSHNGSKTFGTNGYIYVAGFLMHGKQVYSGITATCKVTLNGTVIAQCSATTENNFGDDWPGHSSFSTNFIGYSANANIAASVTGDNGRMACEVFIVFIPG